MNTYNVIVEMQFQVEANTNEEARTIAKLEAERILKEENFNNVVTVWKEPK